MTHKVAKPRARKKKEAARAAIAIREKSTEDSSGSRSSSNAISTAPQEVTIPGPAVRHPSIPTEERSTDDERALTFIRYLYKPPTFYQPSNATPEALDAAFLAHYVQLNAASRNYSPEIQWINHLPRLLAGATKPAVRLSLRAISMASYAKAHQDPGILLDSWRWYNVSLNAQRYSLSKLKCEDMPEEGEVLVPLILGLYELYFSTTAAGAMMHLGAAAKIMKLRGPNNIRTGAIWPLFKSVRNSDVRIIKRACMSANVYRLTRRSCSANHPSTPRLSG